ncbi:hypothetical protein ACHAWU_004530 [Discostella pseudostelligera]|uniref:DUF1279 domain-containing protein n=1 Tax=Discostella pseudostelligera TaxID=259834 RepID=A0ABD3MXQ0_9STRA
MATRGRKGGILLSSHVCLRPSSSLSASPFTGKLFPALRGNETTLPTPTPSITIMENPHRQQLSFIPTRRHHHHLQCHRTLSTSSSSSSFSSLPPDEENAERQRVATLSAYAKEMELRKLDADIARLQTLRGINTGELYTLRGKFKMLSRDYGMGFLAWYWTVWFGTAAMSYVAIEVGGVDPMMVASKVENFLGWEPMSISGKLDPTLGRIGLVVAINECLEPLRLPLVVVTTKPVVNFFSRRG